MKTRLFAPSARYPNSPWRGAAYGLFVCFVSCAPQGPEIIRPAGEKRYNVSVLSSGKTVTDFDKALVHRVALTEGELASFSQAPDKTPGTKGAAAAFPLPTAVDRGRDGKVRGIKVGGERSRSRRRLGLMKDDLITAIGKRHVRSSSDLWTIARDLQKNGQVSLTLERGGQPHKIYYSIKEPHGAEPRE